MAVQSCDVASLGASVLASLLTFACTVIQTWISVSTQDGSSVVFGPYKTCVSHGDHRYCVSNQGIFVGVFVMDTSFLLAISAMITVALLANVVVVICVAIFVFCREMKLKGVRLGAILSAIIGWGSALVCSVTWISKWMVDGASLVDFGPGVWVALASAWVSLAAAILSSRLQPHIS